MFILVLTFPQWIRNVLRFVLIVSGVRLLVLGIRICLEGKRFTFPGARDIEKDRNRAEELYEELLSEGREEEAVARKSDMQFSYRDDTGSGWMLMGAGLLLLLCSILVFLGWYYLGEMLWSWLS